MSVPQNILSDSFVKNAEGIWYITASNFPMWHSPKREDPAIHYKIISDEPYLLEDKVSYKKNGKYTEIHGTDLQTVLRKGVFEWKGKGLLGLLKSKFYFCACNEEMTFMLIYFEKTLFTPEGIDILTRSPHPDEIIFENVHKIIESEPFLKSKSINLKPIAHRGVEPKFKFNL